MTQLGEEGRSLSSPPQQLRGQLTCAGGLSGLSGPGLGSRRGAPEQVSSGRRWPPPSRSASPEAGPRLRATLRGQRRGGWDIRSKPKHDNEGRSIWTFYCTGSVLPPLSHALRSQPTHERMLDGQPVSSCPFRSPIRFPHASPSPTRELRVGLADLPVPRPSRLCWRPAPASLRQSLAGQPRLAARTWGVDAASPIGRARSDGSPQCVPSRSRAGEETRTLERWRVRMNRPSRWPPGAPSRDPRAVWQART